MGVVIPHDKSKLASQSNFWMWQSLPVSPHYNLQFHINSHSLWLVWKYPPVRFWHWYHLPNSHPPLLITPRHLSYHSKHQFSCHLQSNQTRGLCKTMSDLWLTFKLVSQHSGVLTHKISHSTNHHTPCKTKQSLEFMVSIKTVQQGLSVYF